MVVGKQRHAVLTRQRGLPLIEPIVAPRAGASSAHREQRQRAQDRRGAAHVIDRAVARGRRAARARCGRCRRLLVAAHGARPDRSALAPCIAPAPPRPRSPWRRPGRGKAASDGPRPRAASPAPGPSAAATARSIERPFAPALRQRKQRRARTSAQASAPKRARMSCAIGRVAPAGLAPIVAQDGDDVDEAAALDRIVHQMGIAAEPEMDRGRAEFRRTASAGTSARQAVRRAKRGSSRWPSSWRSATTARRRRSARAAFLDRPRPCAQRR